MALRQLPRVDRLVLARVTRVPEWHPEHGRFRPFPVHAWVVHHPDGAILVDTGIGLGHPVIDEWYAPECTPLADALAAVGLAPGDVTAVVLSHLHFDHCGQQGSLGAPVHVQAAEVEAATRPAYTVPEWADVPAARLRLAHGDEEVAEGVRLLATPGHTPGHQSVVVEAAGGGRVILAAQCAFAAAEVRGGEPSPANVADGDAAAAHESLARVRALAPAAVHLSHDPEVVDLGVGG
jgi:N-acyl homoserine lactone hydrolase